MLLIAQRVKWALLAPLSGVIRSIMSRQFHSTLIQEFQVVILKGSILSATEMSGSGEDLLLGSSIPLLLSDSSDFSLFLNNRHRCWAFPIFCALISEGRSWRAIKVYICFLLL